MRRALTFVAVISLSVGCTEEPAKGGLSYQEQQRRKAEAEIKKVQAQINQNLQKNIQDGQRAIKAAQPRVRR
jgi:hypothetical protein